MNADDRYEAENDRSFDQSQGSATMNDYKSRTGQSTIPVQKDEAPVEDPIDAKTADSDAQLARDENEAIDRGNLVGSRTRQATKKAGTYREPGDEEGMPPPDDGTSALRK